LGNGRRESNDLNATVRWTVACARLDGRNTIISARRKCKSIPVPNRSQTTQRVVFLFGKRQEGIERSKCNSPVDCCLRPAGRAQYHNFRKAEMQIDSRTQSFADHPTGGLSFWETAGGNRTHLNATVRWHT